MTERQQLCFAECRSKERDAHRQHRITRVAGGHDYLRPACQGAKIAPAAGLRNRLFADQPRWADRRTNQRVEPALRQGPLKEIADDLPTLDDGAPIRLLLERPPCGFATISLQARGVGINPRAVEEPRALDIERRVSG
jgi:hypothetical protein